MTLDGSIPVDERSAPRKQTPLRMDPDLYDKLAGKAKEQGKSVNTLICDVLDTFCSDQAETMHLSDVKLKIRMAIEQEVRRSGWSLQATAVQRAIYAMLGIR